MDAMRYFRHPGSDGQRQYEVLRASFLERLAAPIVAERFQLTAGNVRVLRHRFKQGLLTFSFRKPTFLITNDDESPIAVLVSRYAQRWNIENGLAEAVKFFSLNALSSPILVKVHFDVVLTMLADTLYYLLARRLRGFEECNAPKIFRHFIHGKGQITVDTGEIVVHFPKRAHNPVIRSLDWAQLPDRVSWLGGRRLRFVWA